MKTIVSDKLTAGELLAIYKKEITLAEAETPEAKQVYQMLIEAPEDEPFTVDDIMDKWLFMYVLNYYNA